MLEAYTTRGYIAATTRAIKIGTMITEITHRHPGVLLTQVSTLDVLSGGRAYFGIGAGWFGEEHRAYGIEFPPARERLECLEETLQVAHRMWADQGDYAEDALGILGMTALELIDELWEPSPSADPASRRT